MIWYFNSHKGRNKWRKLMIYEMMVVCITIRAVNGSDLGRIYVNSEPDKKMPPPIRTDPTKTSGAESNPNLITNMASDFFCLLINEIQRLDLYLSKGSTSWDSFSFWIKVWDVFSERERVCVMTLLHFSGQWISQLI